MIAAVKARLDAANPGAGPKYQVLRDAILETIARGDWEPGARLPTESELSQSLPFSLGTVQRAYGELVKRRVVIRSRGRGSFVSPAHRKLAQPWHCRFLAQDGGVLPVYPTVLGWMVPAEDCVARSHFEEGVVIARIDRLLSVDNEFDVLSRFYAGESIVKAIVARPHEEFEAGNFKAILPRELGIPIARIMQTISIADAGMWASLGLSSSPFVLLEATAYAGEGEVAYFQEFFIPNNRRKLLFDTELHL